MESRRPSEPGKWVLLIYRLPREPSTPRITLWRKVRRLGVAQLADGLVALPADARTREQFEWIADGVREAGGSAGVWIAQPASVAQERDVAAAMAAERAAEYESVCDEAAQAVVQDESARRRTVSRLRAELRRIRRRDFFPPPQRDAAVAAVEALNRGVLTVLGEATEAVPPEGKRR